MKGRRGEIYGDLKEVAMEGLVHEAAGQTPRGQEQRTHTQPSIRVATALAAMFADNSYTIEEDLVHIRMPLRTPEPTEYAARTLGRAV